MTDDRLPTHLWIQAHIRRCSVDGTPAMVVHKGERMSGMLLLKLNQLDLGCRILTQMSDMDGRLGWMPALKGELVDEPIADDYIARAVKRDPDLWVVEIENRKGEHPFEGKIL